MLFSLTVTVQNLGYKLIIPEEEYRPKTQEITLTEQKPDPSIHAIPYMQSDSQHNSKTSLTLVGTA